MASGYGLLPCKNGIFGGEARACLLYTSNLLKKGRFIYVEAYDKVEAWLDKENKPRARVIYRVTNFQV